MISSYIFKNKIDFELNREKTQNGVTQAFLDKYYGGNLNNFLDDNKHNTGCFNCFGCEDCYYCNNSFNCYDCINCDNCYNCNSCSDCTSNHFEVELNGINKD